MNTNFLISEHEKIMFVPQIGIFRRTYLSAGPWVIFKEFSH